MPTTSKPISGTPHSSTRSTLKLANAASRRVHQEMLGHRGHKDDPLFGIRRLLLQARETMSAKGRARLEAGPKAGDPRDEVLDP